MPRRGGGIERQRIEIGLGQTERRLPSRAFVGQSAISGPMESSARVIAAMTGNGRS